MKRLFKLFTIVIAIIAVIALTPICTTIGELLLVSLYAKQMALSLTPPEYLGSKLIDVQNGGGSSLEWERRTYLTSDSIDKVLAFYGEYMPHFAKEYNSDKGVVYRSSKTDTNDLAKRASRLACNLVCREQGIDYYPYVSIILYPNPKTSTETFIEVWINWPAP